MSATWTVSADALELDIKGWDQLWSLKGAVTIPRAAIRSVARFDGELRPPLWRMPGTSIPGVIAAGTYYGDGRREFWMSRFGEDGVVVELGDGAPYTRVVVDVEDLAGLLAALGAVDGAVDETGDERMGGGDEA